VDYEFLVDGTSRTITLEKKGNHYTVSTGGKTIEADIQQISPHVVSIIIKGRSHKIYIAWDNKQQFISLDGLQFEIKEPSQESNNYLAGEGKSEADMLLVKAPMPGKVIKINVSENEEVRQNQTLAIVEAMKMENEIKSSIDGVVKKIYVSTGDLVDVDKPLIELGLK
jgi:biotin carboxyl carrier protein